MVLVTFRLIDQQLSLSYLLTHCTWHMRMGTDLEKKEDIQQKDSFSFLEKIIY